MNRPHPEHHLTLILGGARSGKSRFAQTLASSLSPAPVYLATSRHWDEEHTARIARHQRDRGPQWCTLEETHRLAEVAPERGVVVIDCVTLWLTNLFAEQADVDACLVRAERELEALSRKPGRFLVVSNELGMGVHAGTDVGRKFVDLQGFVNQRLASRARDVLLMSAGLPLVLKGQMPQGGCLPIEPCADDEPSTSRSSGITVAASDVTTTRLPREPPGARAARREALARQARLTKPAGSLGRLEELAVELAAFQEGEPAVRPAAALHFAADHPVVARGIAPFPQSVTRAMVENFLSGGAASSVLCRLYGLPLTVHDVGVLPRELPPSRRQAEGVVVSRTALASAPAGDLASEDAMSPEVFEATLQLGRQAVRELVEGTRLVVLGEMGIGNSTVAAALGAALLELPEPEAMVGLGTGATPEILANKREVVRLAVARLGGERSTREVLRRVGGRELTALVGAMLEASAQRVAVLVDGFIVSAAALAALRLEPDVRRALIFSHTSAEAGHQRLLEACGAKPLLELGLRLGEGSGALAAFPLLEAAVALHRGMATFESAAVPDRSSP